MPFRSEAQRRYMFARHPEIAKRFAAETPKDASLPEHVGDSAAHSIRSVGRDFKKRKKH